MSTKTITRNGFFETNSSSTHSIVIKRSYRLDTSFVLEPDGSLLIHPGEFGWEWRNYYDCRSKASYCLTWLKEMEHNYKKDISAHTELFIEVLKKNTKANRIVFVPRINDYREWGYIDHQSIENGGGALVPAWENNQTLETFIFSPESILQTGNDNDSY